MKLCFKCKEIKPLNEFYKHSAMADGHVNKCKECNKKDVAANYRKNIIHFKDYDKKRANLPHRVEARKVYAKTDAGKAAGNKSKNKWTNSNAIKKGASAIVGNAVRSGKLIKPSSCSECGKANKRIHGHHDDYAKPLNVTWLCAKCHTNWHNENGEGKNG